MLYIPMEKEVDKFCSSVKLDVLEKSLLKAVYQSGCIQYNHFILFVGAGFSNNFGLPTWDKLADDLLKVPQIKESIDDYEEDILHLRSFIQGKEKITYIAKKIEGDDSIDIKEILASELSLNKEDGQKKLKDGCKAVEHILKFIDDYKPVILTTNADEVLENVLSDWKSIDLANSNAIIPDFKDQQYHYIFHLHGIIEPNPQNMVFTYEDYKNLYQSRKFRRKLEKFWKMPILFIGYSLNDFELMYLLEIYKSKEDSFLLYDSYRREKVEQEIMSLKMSAFGITTFPYYKDIEGYKTLDTVFRILLEDMEVALSDSKFYQRQKTIRSEELFREFLDNNAQSENKKQKYIDYCYTDDTYKAEIQKELSKWKKNH